METDSAAPKLEFENSTPTIGKLLPLIIAPDDAFYHPIYECGMYATAIRATARAHHRENQCDRHHREAENHIYVYILKIYCYKSFALFKIFIEEKSWCFCVHLQQAVEL